MVSLTHFALIGNFMMDWIWNKYRDKKHREAREQQLRKSLAEKVLKYEEPPGNPIDDFTEITIGGQILRVAKEQITVTDVLTGSLIKSP